jgi:hypothetical protein
MIYEDIEGGFYPIQQFVNLRSDNTQIADILKMQIVTEAIFHGVTYLYPKTAQANGKYYFSKEKTLLPMFHS